MVFALQFVEDLRRPVSRRLISVLAFAVVAALVPAAGIAQPVSISTRDVVLTNQTGHDMIQFFASSTAVRDWQEDRLGPVLAAGQTRRVTLSRNGGTCQFDFKAVLDDGRSIERRAINVCETPAYTFGG